MLCPNCKTKMHAVETESHYGANLFLDQCPACGGLWFDKRELYRVREGKATEIRAKVDPLDINKLEELVPLEKKLLCPHDGRQLKLFTDPVFPESIEIERCPECGGFWFNRGEFVDFQKWRRDHKKANKSKKHTLDPELKEKINKLLLTQGDKNGYDSIGNLGRFLNQPVCGSSLKKLHGTKEEETPFMYINIIMALLRLFLR